VTNEPLIEVHPLGGHDLVRVHWPGVLVTELKHRTDIYDESCRKYFDEFGNSVWRLNPCLIDKLMLTGHDENGTLRSAVYDCNPCLSGKKSWLIQMRFKSKASSWGAATEASLTLMRVADQIDDTFLPKQILDLQIEFDRLSGPKVRRPFQMLSKRVLSAIRELLMQVELAVSDHRARQDNDDIDSRELMEFLLSASAGIPQITIEGLPLILEYKQTEAEIAGSAIHSIRVENSEACAVDAQNRYWPDALAGLIAQRMSKEEVYLAGLAPTDNQAQTEPVNLASGDRFRISGKPSNMALQIMLPDGSVRWAEHAAMCVNNGELEWADPYDHQAETKLSEIMFELTSAVRKLSAETEGNDKVQWPDSLTQLLTVKYPETKEEWQADLDLLDGTDVSLTWLAPHTKFEPSTAEDILREVGLSQIAVWLDDGLDDSLKNRVLSAMAQSAWDGLNTINLDRLDALGTFVDESGYHLGAVDDILVGDGRYKPALFDATKKLGIKPKEATMSQPMLMALLAGAHPFHGTEFVDAVSNGDYAKAVSTVLKVLELNDGDLRVVEG